MMIIDPPVGPFDPPEAIRAWLARLEQLPADDESVQDAKEEARHWLARAEALRRPTESAG